MDPKKQPGITIGQIFLERSHFEHREDALSLPHSTPVPELGVLVNAQLALSQDETSGIIRIRVQTNTAKKPLYNFDVTLAALILVDPNRENMSVREFAATSGAAMMYPFVREYVASLTSRGRFGPIWLRPFNTVAAFESATKAVSQPAKARKAVKA